MTEVQLHNALSHWKAITIVTLDIGGVIVLTLLFTVGAGCILAGSYLKLRERAWKSKN